MDQSYSNLNKIQIQRQSDNKLERMYNSNFSMVSRFQGNDYSTIQSSSAPGFVPIPCPSHKEYAITNICKSKSCLQPLCPQCITGHIRVHQDAKTNSKIQNIISTRLTCIQQLAQMKFQAEQEISIQNQQVYGNIDQFIQQNQKKIEIAKKKILKMVDDMFQQCFRRMDIIANAFNMQKDKRDKQNRVKLAPLYDYVERVSNYKGQLQSDDYIPALLELLNEPPRKPVLSKRTPIQSCGTIQVNQKYLEDVKEKLQKFIKVTINIANDQNSRIVMNRQNYHNSNNMRFSRMEQSREKDGRSSRSGDDSRVKGITRNPSKKKIFDGASSIVSEIQPITASESLYNRNHNHNPQNYNGQSSIINQYGINGNQYGKIQSQNAMIGVIFNHTKQDPPQIDGSLSYFRNQDDGILAYFQEDSKNYFKAKLLYSQAGFERIPLEINFSIPKKHRSIVTPDANVFLLGGQQGGFSSGKIYKVKKQYGGYQNKLDQMADMIQSRHSFAVCYYRQNLFVFGGLQSNGKIQYGNSNSRSTNKVLQNQNTPNTNNQKSRYSGNSPSRYQPQQQLQQPSLIKVLRKCERYDIKNNKWVQIRQLPQHTYNFQVCAFNNMIVKFGGILQSGQKLHRVDIYFPQTDQWNHLNTEPEVPIYPFMGLCQISRTEMMIFGGINPRNNPQANRNNKKNATSKCYVLTDNPNSNVLEIRETLELYQESSFDMACLYRNGVMAIQYNEQKQKIIMNYRNKQWRFVGC